MSLRINVEVTIRDVSKRDSFKSNRQLFSSIKIRETTLSKIPFLSVLVNNKVD